MEGSDTPYCTECGGKLKWDAKIRHYSCQSCGLTYTEAELSRALEKLYDRDDDDEDEKHRQRNQDYLDWWTSSKKKR
jgi:predicted RNA-binding Zn-ribbon protein involved in translation (DUF1610 family)